MESSSAHVSFVSTGLSVIRSSRGSLKIRWTYFLEVERMKPGETSEAVTINIGNINQGAVIDGFEIELQKALANIADLNTPATATRAIILQLILKPHSDRVVIETEFKVTTKLAGIETHKSKIFMGRAEEGGLVAFDADPRQMPLWSAPKPAKAPEPIAFRTGTEKDKERPN